jgi:VanZ family protein
MRYTSFYFICCYLWFIVITILFCMPGNAFPDAAVFTYDKLAHSGIFTILVAGLSFAVYKQKGRQPKLWAWFAVTGLLYGVVIEFVQKYWIPNRSFDVKDILADGTGCAAGLLIALIFFRSYTKK